ncbi:MAG: hypothetical protein IT374_11345 [Polyangiaceae bacterium]|nr:hypothetical protein [Polyangiaceae bacterium]
MSGSGGSAGGSGSGGAVTAGAAGAAGSGGAATGPRVVAVVTQSSAPPYVATFTDAAGWVETPAGSTVLAGRAGVARSGTGALVVARQPSSALVAATWSAGSLSTFAPLPGFPNATDGPSLSATPDGARLAIAYLGSDARHYGAVYTAAGGLPTAGPLGTDVPQAFGDSVASVAVGAASAYAAYSGDDHGVYALTHDGAQWSTSKPVMGAGTVPTVSPTVVVTNDVPTVLYVEGGGNPTSQVCATRRVGADYLPPACGQNVYTSRTVGAAPLANGKLLVAWHGLESNGNDQRIYAAELDGIKWGVVFQVDQEQDVTSAPVVVTGLAGADAEILYTKGGKLRHARVVGGVATVTVIGGANAVEVGAAVIP